MTKINFIIWCLVLALLIVAIEELTRVGKRVDNMAKAVFDLDLEVSKVTATNGYLGYIGERGGEISVNGEKIRRGK